MIVLGYQAETDISINEFGSLKIGQVTTVKYNEVLIGRDNIQFFIEELQKLVIEQSA